MQAKMLAMAFCIAFSLSSASPLSSVISPEWPFGSPSDAKVHYCYDGLDCMNARRMYAECVSNAKDGLVKPASAFSAPELACLCVKDAPKPNQPEWQSKLYSCALCIEDAAAEGKHDISSQIAPGNTTTYEGICKFPIPFQQFVLGGTLGDFARFPIQIPNGLLKNIAVVTPTTTTSASTLASCVQSSHIAVTLPSEGCTQDNCLRELLRFSARAAPFCATYIPATTTPKPTPPAFIKRCAGGASQISSGCACLASASAHQLGSCSSVTSDSSSILPSSQASRLLFATLSRQSAASLPSTSMVYTAFQIKKSHLN